MDGRGLAGVIGRGFEGVGETVSIVKMGDVHVGLSSTAIDLSPGLQKDR